MGLTFHGGKLLFKDGKLAMGTCTDCCGGSGCAGCGGADCSGCLSLAAPIQWTFTFTATSCPGGVTPFSGTYTLVQTGDSCKWEFNDGTIDILFQKIAGFVLIEAHVISTGEEYFNVAQPVGTDDCCSSFAATDSINSCRTLVATPC